MATVTIQINAGAQTHTDTKTVSGADLTRMFNAYRTIFGQGLTDMEVAQAWTASVFSETRNFVKRTERQTARATADAGLTEIVLT